MKLAESCETPAPSVNVCKLYPASASMIDMPPCSPEDNGGGAELACVTFI